MKKFKCLIVLLLLSPFISCSQDNNDKMEIGKLENNKLEITANKDEVIKMLNKNLELSNVEGKVSSIELKSDTIKAANDKLYYMLLGSNADESVKIAVLLLLDKEKLYAQRYFGANAFYSTCTCFGSCIKRCDPKRNIDEDNEIVWECSACKQQNKTCNKSVTTSN